MEAFVIKAPKPGILIYAKTWKGKKKVVGSRVSAWDPSVAVLPNLVKMVSQTYVNEVDISKVAKGQLVQIELDGAPEIELTGEVDYIATIGEQLPTSEAKVYEVKINIHQSDSTLLPGMSTSNKIVTSRYQNVLYVPIESIFSNDTLSYVFKKTGFAIEKQQVKPGASNVNFAVIEKGLKESDVVLLSIPENQEELKLNFLEE